MDTEPVCSLLEAYLDRRLDAAGKKAFDEHLAGCKRCVKAIEEWARLEEQFVLWDEAHGDGSACPSEVQGLLERAQGLARLGSRGVFSLRLAVSVGAVAALAIVLIAGLWGRASLERHPALTGVKTVEPSRDQGLDVLYPPGYMASAGNALSSFSRSVLVAPQASKMIARLGVDRIGLSPGSKARVVSSEAKEKRIKLVTGTIAAEVAKRRGRGNLVIEAGLFRVSVHGTMFSVRRLVSGLQVAVKAGTVQVSHPRFGAHTVTGGRALVVSDDGKISTRRIKSNERREIVYLLRLPAEMVRVSRDAPVPQTKAATSRPQAAMVMPQAARKDRHDIQDSGPAAAGKGGKPVGSSLLALQKLVVDGHGDEAVKELSRYLGANPGDAGAWSLLGDAERKLGKWDRAVRAYRKTIALADTDAGNRARIKAASILQDRLDRITEAAGLLEGFLDRAPASHPLRAEVLFRLARAYIDMGRVKDAKRTLRTIVVYHKGTKTAAQAGRLLREVEGVE